MDKNEATFPSLSHREGLHQKYTLTGGKGSRSEYTAYPQWDVADLWQWFAYHYGWFWFHTRRFEPTCDVDPHGRRFDLKLVKLAYEMYCSERCVRCRYALRRGEMPCENHRLPHRNEVHRERTPEEIAEVEQKARAAIFAIQRWEERNKEAFNPIAAVHELLGVTASERAQHRDELLDIPEPEQSPLQRRQQLDRYIRREIEFKGQHYDSLEVLDEALKNAATPRDASHRFAPRRAATQRNDPTSTSEIPAWVTESSDG